MSKTVIHASGGGTISNVRVSGGKNFSLISKENEVKITKDGTTYTFTGKSAHLDGERLYIDGKEILDPWGQATKVQFDRVDSKVERKLLLMVIVAIADMALIAVFTRVTEGTPFYFGVIFLWVTLNIFLLAKALKERP